MVSEPWCMLQLLAPLVSAPYGKLGLTPQPTEVVLRFIRCNLGHMELCSQ